MWHICSARRLKTALCVFLIVGVISSFPFVGARPAHAQSEGCTWGDIVCELQQAIQKLIDSYLTPLKDWFLLRVNALIYGFIYDRLKELAVAIWSVEKALFSLGVSVGMLADWIATHLFQPLITATNTISQSTIQGVFVVALAVLGCTYLLSSVVRLRVVNARHAILWLAAALIFFQLGPTLYASMNQFRQSINSYFYAASIQAMANQDPFQKMASDSVDGGSATTMTRPCNNFAAYIPGASPTTVNGLDIALAYLKADGLDIFRGANAACSISGLDATDLPRAWYDDQGYFDAQIAPPTWYDPALTLDQALTLMKTATSMAFAGVSKLLNGLPIIFFGIVEQLVSLCLTIALGLTFISFSCATLFAFFERTEPIAWAVLDQWIALIVQSVVIALVQSMILALYISAANTASGIVTLAIGVVGLVLMSILLWSAIRAIWSAFNRLFESFGQATGGTIISTGQAAQGFVGAAASAASLAVTGGASVMGGMNALSGGATWAQAAGVAFGGSRALDGAAFSLARLPGLRETALGEAANQFVEGSATRRVGENLFGPLGGAVVGPALLTDRNPKHDVAYVDERGQTYWQPSMLNSDVNRGMNTLLAGPGWEPNDVSPIGRGGKPLHGTASADGDDRPLRREVVGREMDDPTSSWGRGASFTPAAASETLRLISNGEGTADEIARNDAQAIADERDSAANSRSTTGAEPLKEAARSLQNAADQQGTAASQTANAGRELSQSVREQQTQRKMDQVEGRMNVSGSNNVAEVMASAVAAIQKQNAQDGRTGADNRTVSKAMAGAMGIDPVGRDGRAISPIERNVPRFQMFADQALQMGLTADMVRQVVGEVKGSPEGQLSTPTRDRLIAHQHETRGESWQDSVSGVQRLEHAARILPSEISAYGMRTAATAGEPPIRFTSLAAGTPIVFTPTVPVTGNSAVNRPESALAEAHAAQPKAE